MKCESGEVAASFVERQDRNESFALKEPSDPNLERITSYDWLRRTNTVPSRWLLDRTVLKNRKSGKFGNFNVYQKNFICVRKTETNSKSFDQSHGTNVNVWCYNHMTLCFEYFTFDVSEKRWRLKRH